MQYFHIARQNLTMVIPDAYTFRRDRRWHRLQRVCLWILAKLKCDHFVEEIGYRSYALNETKLLEIICAQHRDIELIQQKEAAYVVLGRRQMMELELELHSHLTYRSNTTPIPTIGYGACKPSRMIFGLPVHFVPWVDDACIVVPK